MKSARIDAASVVINNLMWVTGGNSPTKFLKSTEFYDFQTDTWTTGPDLPVELKKHSMSVIDDDTVIITGGEYYIILSAAQYSIFNFHLVIKCHSIIIQKIYDITFKVESCHFECNKIKNFENRFYDRM